MLIGQTENSNNTNDKGNLNILDVSEENFVAEVIEKSKEIPVIVDFWAPWCGPCKQITPALEKAVQSESGKVILAKVNIDENQSIAAQLRIQSIPTIYAFQDGQPVDGFTGAQPESAISEFVKKISSLNKNAPNIDELISSANNELVNKNFEIAGEIFEKVLSYDEKNIPAIAGMIRTFIGLNKFEEAESFIENLDKDILDQNEIKDAISALNLMQNSAINSTEIGVLEKKLIKNPNDLQSNFDLAIALFGSNNKEKAINLLLDSISINQNWNDGEARKKLLEFFSAIGHSDPFVVESRKRLSSLIFK